MAKKKAATKKKVTKKTQNKKTTKRTSKHSGPGPKPGTKNHVPVGLEVLTSNTLQRPGSSIERKGLRKAILAASEEQHAVRLETLVDLLNKKNKDLYAFLDKKTPKKNLPKSAK